MNSRLSLYESPVDSTDPDHFKLMTVAEHKATLKTMKDFYSQSLKDYSRVTQSLFWGLAAMTAIAFYLAANAR